MTGMVSGINPLDLVVAVIMVTSIAGGIWAGFARSGVGVLCAILGSFCALWFYEIPAGWVAQWVNSAMLAKALGFAIIFLPFIIAGRFLGRWTMRLFQSAGLGWMDRALGAGFGFLRGALAAGSLVTILLAVVSKPIPEWMVESKTLPYTISASNVLMALAPPALKDSMKNGVGDMREAWLEKLKQSRSELEVLESAKEVLAPRDQSKKRDPKR